MASMKDALEESVQDNSAVFKYIFYTIPLFLLIFFANNEFPGYNICVILTVILLFGFMLKCTYNVRIGLNHVTPSFNIFAVLWLGLKGLIALAPLCIASGAAAIFLVKFIGNYIPDGNTLNILSYIIYGLFGAFSLTSYLLYSNKFKIFDAYNIISIFKYCADVMIAAFFMCLFLVIANVILVAPVTYVLWLFMGLPSPIAIFVWCLFFVFNLAVIGHYLAQISYEIIDVGESKKAN